MLKSTLDELMEDLPDFKPILEEMNAKRQLIFPPSYLDKVKVCLSGLLHIMKSKEKPWQIFYPYVIHVTNTDYATRSVMEQFLQPFYEYLDEKVDGVDLVLFLLARFKLKTEWFDRQDLFNAYEDNTTKGEESLNAALRSYLFDQGINFPFSKPESPSGEVDILPLVELKPITLEVKVFDGDGRGQAYIKQGLHQAFTYAKDYDEPAGYLVIFNVSQYDLFFDLSSRELPSRVAIGDKTIFLLTIDLYPHEETASKRRPKPYHVEEKYLLEG